MTPRPALDFSPLVRATGCHLTPHAKGVEVVDSAGRVRGQVVLDNWTAGAVQAHMAVDTPVAWRALLPAAFDWAFRQAGKLTMLAVIPAGNARALRFTQHVGFRECWRLRDGCAPGEDMVFHEMRATECRWLQQERRAA